MILRMGSWNVCEFVTDERYRIEMGRQVDKRDIDIVRIQEL